MKESKFYLEELPFDPDELEEAIHDELQRMGINHTGRSIAIRSILIIVEYEPQENDDE